MNRAERKLRSRKGASITFGLLLFLVCAIVSSAVLVAATTASGRMAGIAETDQRYYSVTSACELLKDFVDGESASVVKIKTPDEEDPTIYVFNKPAFEVDDGDIAPGSSEAEYIKYTGDSTEFKYITQAAISAYYNTAWDEQETVLFGDYTLSSELGTGSADPLAVDIKAYMYKDGSIAFEVQSKANKKGQRFKQRIFFSGTKTDPDHTSLIHEGDGGSEIEAVSITWTLTSVTTL